MSRAQLTSTVEQNTGGAVAPFVAGKNKIINGDFGVWQRGTSFSGTVYTADRWLVNYGTSPTVTQSTDVPNSNYLYSLSVSGSNYTTISQRIESFNARQLVGKTITLSFWAKQTSGSGIGVALYYATAVDNFASVTQISSNSPSVTSSWAYYQIQIPASSVISSVANGLVVAFNGSVGSSTFLLAGVQLEAGSVATPFTTATGTVQGELAACQRYYQRFTSPNSTSSAAQTIFGMAQSTTILRNILPTKVTMRTVPSSIDFSNLEVVDGVSGYAISAVSFAVTGSADFIDLLFTSTGLTQFRGGWVNTTSSAGYLGVSAEL